MLHEFYQYLPFHINPIAFSVGFISIRWYAISYLIGFVVVYLVLWLRIKRGEITNIYQNPKSKIQIYNKIQNIKPDGNGQLLTVVFDYLLLTFFLAIIGGRLGYVLLYNLPYFLKHPLQIVSPFDSQSGQYVGIFGMSYHGALLVIVIGSWIFVKKKKIDFFAWADFVAPAAALGYFFGRIGNFLNGELYGRATNSFWGMYFVADKLQLRHPSQLYEAMLEGLLLFALLWNLRNLKFKKGTLFAIYLIGYGCLRIIVEYFREPDSQLGFLFEFMTMGQLLSVIMVLLGIILLFPKKGNSGILSV